METFKFDNHVYVDKDFIYGRIVEIDGDLAHVEFRSSEGGGCLPYKLSELTREKWYIATKLFDFDDEISYFVLQKPTWGEDGYFWTRDIVENITNNTFEYLFLFNK